MKTKNNLLIFLIFVAQTANSQIAYRIVTLFNGQIYLRVPYDWIQKDNYLKFSDYEIIYNSRISNRDKTSIITVKVLDKKYSEKESVTNDRMLVERESDSLRWKSVNFVEAGIELLDKSNLGFLKYTFVLNNVKHYMIHCCTKARTDIFMRLKFTT